jgi:SEC-C motif-containing protein
VSAACPCGDPAGYDAHCGRFHRGELRAPTAEALMRSRFSAFAVEDAAYLLATWHPATRPARVRFVPGQRWTRLEVLATTGGDLLDAEGTVEFRAHHERHGRAGVLHEHSRFVRADDAAWLYADLG